MSELEKVMEDKLIRQLTTGDSQWTYRSDIKTEDDLWNNLRKRLNFANRSKLGEQLITDAEMAQIKEFIRRTGTSAYNAGLWLSGEHGVAQIPLQREDARLGTISLAALDSSNVAGGTSCYEVINQYQSSKDDGLMSRDRRFDVTLLINGLPLIHIELKSRNHPFMDAFRQIQKYQAEGKFTGIFGLIQMFVVSNGTNTYYIASSTPGQLNEKFLTRWVDQDNNPVDDYIGFAKEALHVPEAHKMLCRYSVLDSDSKRVILLRPYQIHAIEAVEKATREHRSGFIWHTTGSGKTLTSFNVTSNLLDIPSVDKTVFLIDRHDLDQQTSLSFMSYARNSDLQIDSTSNTGDLERKLLNKDRQAIVTTIQKFQHLLHRYSKEVREEHVSDLLKELAETKAKLNNASARSDADPPQISSLEEKAESILARIENEKSAIWKLSHDRGDDLEYSDHDRKSSEYMLRQCKALKAKNICFVVDECHRTVTPETKRDIERFFDRPDHKSLWYGFTGTPIIDENARATKGNLPKTTAQLFGNGDPKRDGEPLHRYTLLEAIKDKAVLGFHTIYQGERRSEFLKVARKLAAGSDGALDTDVDALDDEQLEAYVIKNFPIKEKSHRDFYDTDEHRTKVIEYIVNENASRFRLSRGSGNTYEAMLTCANIAEAQRYYELFMKFKAQGRVDERIRSMVPDFPKVAITYSVGENADGAMANQEKMKQSLADYNAMFGTKFTLEGGLAAYNTDLNARLARKQGRYKQREQQLDLVIVVDRLLTGFDAPCLAILFIDRKPMNEQGLIQAFSRTNRLFDKEKRYGEIVAMRVPATFEHSVRDALSLFSHGGTSDVSAPSYKEIKKELLKAARALKDCIKANDSDLGGETASLQKFAKAFQEYDRLMDEIHVYDEWADEDQEKVTLLSQEDREDAIGRYQNVIEELKRRRSDPDEKDEPLSIDVEYELETFKEVTIDYKYLVSLLQEYFSDEEGQDRSRDPEDLDKRIDKCLREFAAKHPRVSEIARQLLDDVKNDPEKFRGKNAASEMELRINLIIEEKLNSIASELCVDHDELLYTVMHWKEGDRIEIEGDYERYKAQGGTLSKLKYKRMLRERIEKVAREDVAQLMVAN